MTCDLCGQNEATVHLTEIIDDQTRELHLCESCAHEKGTAAGQEFGLAGLLAGLADFGLKGESTERTKLSCPRCGMTYEGFRKVGRLGCGNCYETFEPYLVPLLKRIHGSTQHVGKGPSVSQPKAAKKSEGRADARHFSGRAADAAKSIGEETDLARLKENLKKAVAAEAFEEAARLRDRVRAVEEKAKAVKGEESRVKGKGPKR